jgi:hypothetical protein
MMTSLSGFNPIGRLVGIQPMKYFGITDNGRRVHDVLRNQARGLSGVRCREPVDIRSSSAASTEYIDGCNPPPDIQDTSIASILYIVSVSTTPMSLTGEVLNLEMPFLVKANRLG